MKKIFFGLVISFLLISCAGTAANKERMSSNAAIPAWVVNPGTVYPSKDWIAVTAESTGLQHAESAALNALARIFKTDLESITKTAQEFTEIIDSSAGRKAVTFNESKNFSQEVTTKTTVTGLIGVEIDAFRDNDGIVHAIARMNRQQCAARYSGMVRENTAIINSLLAGALALPRDSLDAYARLSFAYAIAQVTDNFQSILEVLDSSYTNRKPNYGGANAIKAKMIEQASFITIGVAVNTERAEDKTLFNRAAGSFFRDSGFKINESGQGNYILKANVRFETIIQSIVSSRYYIDAALENAQGKAVFSFTENDRKAHPNTESEARRLAVRAVEESFKEGKFAREFNAWLGGLIE